MRKDIFIGTICILIASLFLAACTAKTDEPRPPEMFYGQDVCDQCGMVIDEKQYAAATLLTNDEYLKFDDVGEMFEYHMDHPEAQAQAWFVHDYNSAKNQRSDKWIRGEGAFYVESQELKTPMGTGIVAFSEREAAEQFAAEWNGKVYTFDEMRVHVHQKIHGSVNNKT
jgi:copper chaperone NosL